MQRRARVETAEGTCKGYKKTMHVKISWCARQNQRMGLTLYKGLYLFYVYNVTSQTTYAHAYAIDIHTTRHMHIYIHTSF